MNQQDRPGEQFNDLYGRCGSLIVQFKIYCEDFEGSGCKGNRDH